jgi:hypothetical protein
MSAMNLAMGNLFSLIVGLAVANPRVHLSITFDNNGNYVFN